MDTWTKSLQFIRSAVRNLGLLAISSPVLHHSAGNNEKILILFQSNKKVSNSYTNGMRKGDPVDSL